MDVSRLGEEFGRVRTAYIAMEWAAEVPSPAPLPVVLIGDLKRTPHREVIGKGGVDDVAH